MCSLNGNRNSLFVQLLFTLIIIYFDSVHGIKSVSLSPAVPTDDGASITRLKDTSVVSHKWRMFPSDNSGFQMQLSLDYSWSFDPIEPTTLQLQIQGNSAIDAPLVVSFSQSNDTYFSTVLEIDQTADHRIYPQCQIHPDTQAYANGNIYEMLENSPNRIPTVINNDWESFLEPRVHVATPTVSYPLTFTLHNNPSDNSLLFSYTNPNTNIRTCSFVEMAPNIPLNVYLAVAYNGQKMSVSSVDVAHFIQSSATDNPTLYPSLHPTQTPSQNPTKYPSNMPTDIPSNAPTNVPTAVPSNIPTNMPTNMPINTGINPTNVPTNFPSNMPTNTPSKIPTQMPTNTPTNTPSNIPTNVPTDAPTNVPTNKPTNMLIVTPKPSTASDGEVQETTQSNSIRNENGSREQFQDTNSGVSSTNLMIITTIACFFGFCFCGITALVYLCKHKKSNIAAEGVSDLKINIENSIANNSTVPKTRIIASKSMINYETPRPPPRRRCQSENNVCSVEPEGTHNIVVITTPDLVIDAAQSDAGSMDSLDKIGNIALKEGNDDTNVMYENRKSFVVNGSETENEILYTTAGINIECEDSEAIPVFIPQPNV